MHGDDEDVFDSVTWESASAPYDVDPRIHTIGPGFKQSTAGIEEPRGPHDPKWEGYLVTMVKDPVKELAETKDAYVSYLVTAKVRDVPRSCPFRTHRVEDEPSHILFHQPIISSTVHGLRIPAGSPSKKFPCMCGASTPRQAQTGYVLLCPVEHTIQSPSEYITGDRFSPEFMERRRLEYVRSVAVISPELTMTSLHRFLQRIARHPTLQRSTLLRAFFESTEWVWYWYSNVF